MNIIGQPPINPFLFYSGKIAGYVTWLVYLLSIFQVIDLSQNTVTPLKVVSHFTFITGLLFAIVSFLNLGESTRLGIPEEETELKTKGLYRISRNPMYVGFNLFTISAILYTMNFFIIAGGIYSIVVYHLIILGEEKFLEKRFGSLYTRFKKKVRRYL